ncbi:MAG: class I SAM-dependent methyltransferase [Actinomycetota bacterium]|nr:class I SAM-dependent methyltransferase [Actinomycetota bacterium]
MPLPARVPRLLAVEPSRSSIRHADARIAASMIPVEVIGADGQRLPLPDTSVDAALCTWSLCTIPDPVAAVGEVARVLRPGGQLHFVEHGLAPDDGVRRWQSRLNRFQQRFVGGCTLDLDIPALLRAGGMTVARLERYYGQGEPKPLAAMYEGTAVPA